MDRFKRFIGRLYTAALAEENIPRSFRSHMFVMRSTGIWSMPNDPLWYDLLTIVLFFFIGFLYPLSEFINIFFVDTVEKAMDHSFLSLTCWSTAFKAGVFYWRRDSIRELYRIHAEFLRTANHHSAPDINSRIVRVNIRVHRNISTLYVLGWCGFVAQTMLSPPGDGMLSSTGRMPFDFTQRRSVYWTVMIYQMVSNLCLSVWAANEDAFSIALMNTLYGHMAQLKDRLQHLDREYSPDVNADRDFWFYKSLIECCQRYEDCLK